jgi:SAM-dependent methyltransferase
MKMEYTMDNIDNQTEYWNKVAYTKIFTHPVNMELLSWFTKKDEKIVDYGCGYGRIVKQLIDSGYNIVGYDTSVEMIKKGKDQIIPVDHINQPNELPIADNSVDCILLFAVLTCIPSNFGQSELIKLLRSKLKPGGVLYVSDYYLMPDFVEVGLYECLNNDYENYGVFTLPEGVTFRHHSKNWISKLLKDFKILYETLIEVKTMNGHYAEAFQVIAKK